MTASSVDSIVSAVLYEGYMLYPYRASSVKNRQRWTFGGVYPQAYSAAQGGAEPWAIQVECLVEGGADMRVTATPGFLHLVEREAGALPAPLPSWPEEEPAYRVVAALAIDNARFYTWQEATERRIMVEPLGMEDAEAPVRVTPFALPGQRDVEPLHDAQGAVAGVLVRTRQPIEGAVETRAQQVADGVWGFTARVANRSPMADADGSSRAVATRQALVSCHIVLTVTNGRFLSSIDPPPALAAAAAACDNVGVWPVLAGDPAACDTMLASPIILYDFPQIAPESPGDLFDGTEIDEILTLRILSMTDEEKREMAAVDERSRALLERTEKLTASQLQRLHGVLRGVPPALADVDAGALREAGDDAGALRETGDDTGALREIDGSAGSTWKVGDNADSSSETEGGAGVPWHVEDNSAGSPWEALDSQPRLAYVRIAGADLRVGDKVRLRPRGNADIFDLALAGKVATIESLERDFDDRVHIAIILDDDPGRDLGVARMPGHRFFFAPDEVEPVSSREAQP